MERCLRQGHVSLSLLSLSLSLSLFLSSFSLSLSLSLSLSFSLFLSLSLSLSLSLIVSSMGFSMASSLTLCPCRTRSRSLREGMRFFDFLPEDFIENMHTQTTCNIKQGITVSVKTRQDRTGLHKATQDKIRHSTRTEETQAAYHIQLCVYVYIHTICLESRDIHINMCFDARQ